MNSPIPGVVGLQAHGHRIGASKIILMDIYLPFQYERGEATVMEHGTRKH